MGTRPARTIPKYETTNSIELPINIATRSPVREGINPLSNNAAAVALTCESRTEYEMRSPVWASINATRFGSRNAEFATKSETVETSLNMPGRAVGLKAFAEFTDAV